MKIERAKYIIIRKNAAGQWVPYTSGYDSASGLPLTLTFPNYYSGKKYLQSLKTITPNLIMQCVKTTNYMGKIALQNFPHEFVDGVALVRYSRRKRQRRTKQSEEQ